MVNNIDSDGRNGTLKLYPNPFKETLQLELPYLTDYIEIEIKNGFCSEVASKLFEDD